MYTAARVGRWQKALEDQDPSWKRRLPDLGRKGSPAVRTRLEEDLLRLWHLQQRPTPQQVERWSLGRLFAAWYERRAEADVRANWPEIAARLHAEEEAEQAKLLGSREPARAGCPKGDE